MTVTSILTDNKENFKKKVKKVIEKRGCPKNYKTNVLLANKQNCKNICYFNNMESAALNTT